MQAVGYTLTVEGKLYKGQIVDGFVEAVKNKDFEEENLTVGGIINEFENQVFFELEDDVDNLEVTMEPSMALEEFLEEVIKEVKDKLKEQKK